MGEAAVAAGTGRRRHGFIERLAALNGGDRAFNGGGSEPSLSRAPAWQGGLARGLGASVLLGGLLYVALVWVGLGPATGTSADGARLASGQSADPGQILVELPAVGAARAAVFPLLITGLDGAQETRVVLKDLPEAAWFSHGARRDEHTWELAAADLAHLQITLREGAPETFIIAIDVVGAQAGKLAEASAFVRVNRPPASAMAAARVAAGPTGTPDRRAPLATQPEAAARLGSTGTFSRAFLPRETFAKTGVGGSDRPGTASPATRRGQSTPLPVGRPEGMSTLGAVPREGPRGNVLEGRRLWWTMPAPGWALFGSGAGGRH
jgi:hypothetical protein